MKITGKIHCFFEQSGTFKTEFKKLGYEAYDYDIQNNFGQTDYVIDLFSEIENGFDGKPSLFDKLGGGDLIMAFFPCIYFCETSACAMRLSNMNYRKMPDREKVEKILERSENRQKFYHLLIKLFSVVMERGLKMVVENPYSPLHYLHNNFLLPPSLIDRNRRLRGDYFVKPTQYWFVGFEPTHGCTLQENPIKKSIRTSKSAVKTGVCSEERSMISPDYARNFICDFIIGKEQLGTQKCLFE